MAFVVVDFSPPWPTTHHLARCPLVSRRRRTHSPRLANPTVCPETQRHIGSVQSENPSPNRNDINFKGNAGPLNPQPPLLSMQEAGGWAYTEYYGRGLPPTSSVSVTSSCLSSKRFSDDRFSSSPSSLYTFTSSVEVKSSPPLEFTCGMVGG